MPESARPAQHAHLDSIRDMSLYMRRCWQAPDGLRRLEALDVTVRFSVKADGSLLGERRVVFANASGNSRARDVLAHSALDAIEACAPLPISAGLGRAVAGRQFTVRFTYNGPKGRGV